MRQDQLCENPANMSLPHLIVRTVMAGYLVEVSKCKVRKFTAALTYVFSWRTKLLKLLCLKNLGRRSLENSAGFQTTKL